MRWGWQWELGTDVGLRTGFGQFPLALALARAVFLGATGQRMATGAADTRFIQRRIRRTGLQGLAACAAQCVVAWDQPVPD